ncbi:MAG TPA: GspE/PulE family protein [Candidatus Hydrogenedentes bacterium]|nr:GspE/PulE family protein [Candidatus Hydrogenedentota bacterium]HPG65759.1 GspE/PulE family protein [Candidatus Hydrogenedentota bacterium]
MIPKLRVLRRETPGVEATTPVKQAIPAVEALLLEQLASGERGIIRAVDVALQQAAFHRASDIHFEPQDDGFAVRYRIDGLLHPVARLPRTCQDQVLTRLKVLAKLIVYKRDIPQEGRIDAGAVPEAGAMRVSTFPTVGGEKAVVRLLDTQREHLRLNELGFPEDVAAALREFIGRPHGTLLLTGPSSSGKTTTIYALLREIAAERADSAHICTVEDPVEYRLGNVAQTQVNPAAGLTFHAAVRSLMRQDPDVIMVGEVRDAETAHAVIQAGLTGHLVISTVHSGTAAGVFARLLEMGIEPFLIASSVTNVLAQRLVRRVCPECAVDDAPDVNTLRAFGLAPGDGAFRRGAGCEACQGVGYRGRMPITELLRVDESIAECILERPRTAALAEAARKNGMRSLAADGAARVRQGMTTLDELSRVLPTESEGRDHA